MSVNEQPSVLNPNSSDECIARHNLTATKPGFEVQELQIPDSGVNMTACLCSTKPFAASTKKHDPTSSEFLNKLGFILH
jgi:hypothetical protein